MWFELISSLNVKGLASMLGRKVGNLPTKFLVVSGDKGLNKKRLGCGNARCQVPSPNVDPKKKKKRKKIYVYLPKRLENLRCQF